MRKKISKIFFLVVVLIFAQISSAQEIIRLENPEKPQIIYSKKPEEIKGKLFIENIEEAQVLIQKQQETDMRDIENIWNATVSKNPVISFSLAKLAIPEEQRRVHSSFMAKTLSAIISGASMLPSFLGSNYAIQTASYAGGRLAHNLINRENFKKMQNSPLTDTEIVELAGLIEELQDDIVTYYYAYKGNLIRLREVRSDILLYNSNYNKALEMNDTLEITVSSALWDEALMRESEVIEEVKKYQVLLERLAGSDIIPKLELVQYNFDINNIDPEALRTDIKKIKSEVQL